MALSLSSSRHTAMSPTPASTPCPAPTVPANVLSIAGLVAESIRRIHVEESISSLFVN